LETKVKVKRKVEKMKRMRLFMLLGVFAIALCLQISEVQAKWFNPWVRVYEGVEYCEAGETNPLQRVFACRIDLWNPEVGIKVTPGNGGAIYDTVMQTTPAFASQYGLEAAINANFWWQTSGSNADVTGPLVSAGNIVSYAGPFNYESCNITQDKVPSFFYSTSDPVGWYNGVTGDVRMLINGVPNDGWKTEYQPRTAIAGSADGRYLFFVVIDGRQPGWSNGATWIQLGQWCKDFGAWNGIALDGGGSSTMVVGGAVKNSPSDGQPRSVGSNIGIDTWPCTTTGPSACSMNANRFDIVNRDRYSRVQLRTWTSSGGWVNTDLGGVTYETPAIVSRTDGILDAFCTSTTGVLHQNHYENGSWSGWQNLNQNLASGSAVCSQNVNSITICARNGGDNHVYVRNWTTSGGWGSWVCLYGTTYDSPAIVSRADGILDVFVRGPDGKLYQQCSYDGGSTWLSGWYNHGFAIASAPAALSRHSGNIEIFYRGTNGNLMDYHWDSSTGWSSADHGGQIAGVPAICNRTSDSLDIFVRGTADDMFQLGWSSAGGWWASYYNMGAYYW
jgi:hypothetical protein